MEAGRPGRDVEEYRVSVAPIISDEKASFVARQVASTLSGGIRFRPGMTPKAYAFQLSLWVAPLVLGVVVVFGLGHEEAPVRFLVAGTAAAAFVASVDLFKWQICRNGVNQTSLRNFWFTDYDDVDYSSLLSSTTLQTLLPPRRSWGHAALGYLLSFVLIGTAASVLDTDSVEASGISGASALIISLLCLITAATAQFGLTAGPPPEVTSHRYCDPLTLTGLLEDYSRPLLVVLLLALVFLDLPGNIGAGLYVFAAVLPVLWSIGLVPQLATLIGWAFEQMEVHLFGGTPMPDERRLFAAVLASFMAAALAGVTSKVAVDAGSSPEVATVLVVACGLPVASLLALLPPRMEDLTKPFAENCGFALLQALVAFAISIGVLFGLGVDEVRSSLDGKSREMSPAWMLRLIIEQVAAFLCFVAIDAMSAKRLRFGGWYQNEASSAAVLKRTSFLYAVLEASARVLLLVHAIGYGAVGLVAAHGDDQLLAFDAAVLLRAWRVVLVDPSRAAGDAWLAGALDAVLCTTGSTGGFLGCSLGARLFIVSVLRQRLLELVKRSQYASHLAHAAMKIPKLRHPITGKVLVANAIFSPLLIVVLILSTLLESPLVALFTLPLFMVGYPRQRHGHPELVPDGTSLVKAARGLEGVFYSILQPSLLAGLAPCWRCGALSRQPGAIFFCRSHERLACLVRVLSSGLGWVQVEVRGLEMQEPTSCHHVEAGLIDDAFSRAFGGEHVEPQHGATGRSQLGGSSGPRDAQSANAAEEGVQSLPPPLFVLRPVCEVKATTYEQTQLSLAGVIDSQETLRQLHRLFLKTLTWVMARYCNSAGPPPQTWLSCPLKARDATGVLNMLRTSSWSQHVAEIFETQAGTAPTASASAGAIRASASSELVEGESVGSPHVPTPPSIRQADVGREPLGRCLADWTPPAPRSPACAWAPDPVARVPSPPLASAPTPLPVGKQCGVADMFDKDFGVCSLTDQIESVQDWEPLLHCSCGTTLLEKDKFCRQCGKPRSLPPCKPPVRASPQSHPLAPESPRLVHLEKTNFSRVAPLPPLDQPSPLRPLRLPFHSPDSSPQSGSPRELDLEEPTEDLDKLMDMVLDIAPAGLGKKQKKREKLPSKGQRQPHASEPSLIEHIALPDDSPPCVDKIMCTPSPPLGAWRDAGPPSPPQGALGSVAASKATVEVNGERFIKAPARLDEYDPVTQLVVQSYVAINVAPTYGQNPEVLGPGHAFKVFTGLSSKTSTAAEAVWLGGLPELEELALCAFRYAFKITVDCMAMGEDPLDMEDKELESELRTLDNEWHLGVEGSSCWQAAMEQRLPYMMAMRKQQSSAAYQVVRLCLNQDKVRVAELRSEVVQSIWASASVELRYFTNDDDERYSIQAHPTLLRNMIVQSAEYPIFVSPPTTIWL